ncbi:PEP-CTERM/exosortase system-associated acyltransferase, partial [Chromatiaceae bacterium AAb-1]|nr:PEP-CTERM/exosortase system-associated acyltransferase [Chromatiaceae bacterium AAb-1]
FITAYDHAADTLKNTVLNYNNDINFIIRQFPFFFSAGIADTTQQKTEIFRLRHQVYCEELCFEPLKEDCLESDQFDLRSVHCAIRHQGSSQLAGTLRIITSQHADELLPIEQHFSDSIQNSLLAPAAFPRQHICEISRLAVPEIFRRRQKNLPQNISSDLSNIKYLPENHCYPLIAIALYLIAALITQSTQRFHVYVMVEPGLARILQRIGINLQCIGSAIQFNGNRAPYYLDARTIRHTLQQLYRPLQEQLSRQLFAEQYHVAI